jgi:DNA-binding transcriptional ArsR family regulator
MEGVCAKIQKFEINELLNLYPSANTLKSVRPLFNPAIEDVTVEGVLYALSDPVRVAIYADIVAQEHPQNCSTFLTVRDKAIPKSTLSQHFRILRENGLIHSERHGVEMRNISRCTEVDGRFPGLIRTIVNAYLVQSGESGAKKKGSKRAKAR